MQPLFDEWRTDFLTKEHVMSPDGTEPHLIFKLALDEALNPQDPTNAAPNVRLKTIEYLEVQCAAALQKMTDSKLALARNLPQVALVTPPRAPCDFAPLSSG